MILPLPGKPAAWPNRNDIPFHLPFQAAIERLQITLFHDQRDERIFEQPNRHILLQLILIFPRFALIVDLALLLQFPLNKPLAIVRQHCRIKILPHGQDRLSRKVLDFQDVFQRIVIGLTAPSFRIKPLKHVLWQLLCIQKGAQKILGSPILQINGENPKG